MKMTEKGQVTIPKPLRERYGLVPGTEIRFVEREHRVVVEKASGYDVWGRYYGYLQPFLKKRWRTHELIRLLRGARP